MKRFILPALVLSLLLTTVATAQFDYSYKGRAKVGHQPVAIYDVDDELFGYKPVVYCAGKDLNYNGVMDEGDEAPSIWALPYFYLLMFQTNGLISEFDGRKLIDLEFKMPVLPVRNYWDNNEKKLYVINSNSISKITFISEGHTIDSVLVEKVVDVTASAVSSSGDYLYISVRPSYTDPGYVLVYDKIKKVYTDTIPAGISVQQTIPTGAGGLFIISEGTFGKGGGKFQVVDVSSAKHTIIKEMDIDGTPTHIDYSEYEQSVFFTCNASNQIKKIKLSDYAIDSLSLALGTYDGPRESVFQTGGNMNGLLLTSAYDGNVYIHQGKKQIGKFDAKAKPEGFMAIGDMFFIATPYLDSTYTLDSNVTIYSLPMDVAENPAEEGYYIYPNPADGIINIESPSEFNLSYAVLYNSMGEKISNLQISGEPKNISLKELGLSPGAYFIKISNGSKNLTLPFVIK